MAAKIMADLALHISTNIAELKKGIDQANGKLNSLQKGATSVGTQVVAAFAKIGGVIMGLKGAFDFMKASFESTGVTADNFARTIEGVKQGFDAVKRAVATLDFKDFIKNVKTAIDEGKRYADSLDDLDEKTRQLMIAEADAANEIIKQKKIQMSALSTNDEKIAAGQKIIKLEEDLAGIRTGIAQQAYTNELTNIASITGLTNEEVEAYLRGDEALKQKIKSAELYNGLLAEETKLAALNIQGQLNADQIQRYDQVKKAIALVTDETKKYIKAAKYMSDDPKLNLAVEKYVALQEATRSALENTLKVSNKLDAALVKETKTVNDLADAYARPELIGRQSGRVGGAPKTFGVPNITSGLKLPQVSPIVSDAEQTQGYADRTIAQVQLLTNVFGTMFSSIEDGWSGMARAFGNMLKQLAIQVATYSAVFVALKLLFPATAAKGLGKFGAGLLKSVFGFANGTSFAPGGLSLVGERGPELVNLPRGSQVYTNSQTNSMMGGGEVVFRIEGTTLVGILNKQNKISYA